MTNDDKPDEGSILLTETEVDAIAGNSDGRVLRSILAEKKVPMVGVTNPKYDLGFEYTITSNSKGRVRVRWRRIHAKKATICQFVRSAKISGTDGCQIYKDGRFNTLKCGPECSLYTPHMVLLTDHRYLVWEKRMPND